MGFIRIGACKSSPVNAGAAAATQDHARAEACCATACRWIKSQCDSLLYTDILGEISHREFFCTGTLCVRNLEVADVTNRVDHCWCHVCLPSAVFSPHPEMKICVLKPDVKFCLVFLDLFAWDMSCWKTFSG